MNESEKRIEQLLDRYFEATTTDAEEQELRNYFRERKSVPASLRTAQAMFCGMDELHAEQCAAETTIPQAPMVPLRWRIFGRGLLVGGAAAVLILGLFLGVEHLRKPYCYIDGVAIYDREVAMQTTVYLDALSNLSQSAQMMDQLFNEQ